MNHLALWFLLLSISFLTHAETFSLTSIKNKTVEFTAIGRPSALKIHGVNSNDTEKSLTGNLVLENTKLKGDAVFLISSLETGIALRDKHLKEKYLESGKFPNAKIRFTECQISGGICKGLFELKGKQKEITLQTSLEKSEKETSLDFQFEIKPSEFGIETPNYLGITIADSVSIKVHIINSL